MEPYLVPLFTTEPLLACGGLLGINWVAVAATVLIAAGQTIASNNRA